MIVPEDNIMCLTPTPEQEARMEEIRKFYEKHQRKQNCKNQPTREKTIKK